MHFLNEWNPHLFIDTHTTNGSHHRYTITYEGTKNPAGDPKIVGITRQTLFPEVSAEFTKMTKLNAFYYGNFNRDHTQWTSYPAEARYGVTYVGLRNRLAALSEAYSYAPFKTRVLATRDFVGACLEFASSHKEPIITLLDKARQASTRAAEPNPECAIDSDPFARKAAKAPATVLGYVEREENGRRIRTDTPKDYTLQLMTEFEPSEAVIRPFAYLVPPTDAETVATLKRHGLDVQELRETIELDLEVYRVDAIQRSTRRFEGHHLVDLKVSPRKESRLVPAGTLLVRTAQPLGALAVYLLEPRSEDGLATWNFFDSELKEGGDFPVSRLLQPVAISLTGAEPLADYREPARPITFDMAGGGGGRGRGGAGRPATLDRWGTLVASPRRPTPESEGRDGPRTAVLRRESPGERPDKDQVAQRQNRSINRSPDLLRHGPKQTRIPVPGRSGLLLRDV